MHVGPCKGRLGRNPRWALAFAKAAINAGLANPKMKVRVAEMGETTISTSPADFGKLIAEETEKWGKLIRAANIKAE
jgi:tripartite-type tricarboxylate transporter receptor subunit TctC